MAVDLLNRGGFHHRRMKAALGQRSGMEAPPGQQCFHCHQGKGPFASCVVHLGIHSSGSAAALGSGVCMCCLFSGFYQCCLRYNPNPANWYIEYFSELPNARGMPFQNLMALDKPAPATKAITAVPRKSTSSSLSSTQSKKGGISYSETRYNTPLDNAALAKNPDGIVAVCEDLRVIRARVEYDIKKLS